MYNEDIRFYKGVHMVKKISKMSPQKTAKYELREDCILGKKGSYIIAPVRLCFKLPKVSECALCWQCGKSTKTRPQDVPDGFKISCSQGCTLRHIEGIQQIRGEFA